MRLAIVANETLKQELSAISISPDCIVEWLEDITELPPAADAIIDLLFEENESHTEVLKRFLPKPVIVSSVIKTIDDLGHPFIRINGWPTFLNRKIIEASCKEEKDKEIAERFFSCFNRKAEWVPDIPGFISARVVSMIINEAYFALSEKVSSKKEIDTAMKLGTNYPYGPFEWAEKIGLNNISTLLSALAKKEKRYEPASLLLKEAKEL